MKIKLLSIIIVLFSAVSKTSNGQPADKGKAVLNYYIFGSKTGSEKYSVKDSAGLSHYYSHVESVYFNNINKTVSLSFSGSNQLKTCSISGSSFSWYDSSLAVNKDPKQTIMQAASEPLPVSLLGLLIRQYWGIKSSDVEMNQPSILYHGINNIKGINENLYCYSVENLTWGHCFVWLNKNFEVRAAVCPLVYYTVYVLGNNYESAKANLEKAYARISVKVYTDKVRVLNNGKISAITHVQIWEGSSDRIYNDMTIIFSQKEIISIIPTGRFKPANEIIIDGTGKTIIPGLWEMHMHIRQPEWLFASLAAGVTSVRDMGNDFDYIQTLSSISNKQGSFTPFIYKAGWIDGKSNWSFQYSGYQANSKEDAEKWVEKYYKGGFNQIKIWENLRKDIAESIISKAHQKGMKVVGHIPEAFSFGNIIEAGINQISHLSEIVYAYEQDSIYNTIEKVVDLFSKYKVGIDPTFLVMDIGWRNKNRPLSEIEPGAALANKYVLKAWEGFGTDSLRSLTRGKQVMSKEGEMIFKLYKAGIPVVAGADGGIPGHSLHRELELYVKYGLTPMEALKTATTIPAQQMSMHPEKYFILAGNTPNFVLLNGNPFENISNVRNIFQIISNGIILDPDNLWQLIGFSPSKFN